MHAAGSPPAPDLIGFSPAHPLINFDENVVPPRSLVSPALIAEAQPSELQTSKSTSPLPDTSIHEPVSSVRAESEDVLPVRSSETERGPSPIVRIPPPVESVQSVNNEQIAQANKIVRFDLRAQRINSTPSDSGSEDPLAPNATMRKNLRSKQATNISASSKVSPLDAAKSRKPLRPKPDAVLESATIPEPANRKRVGILDQFKDGHLNSESDDDDQAPAQMQSQTQSGDSQDTCCGITC
jgi:hypothetical protein